MKLVLIESDWNLKFTDKQIDALWKIVLIESDWNLKLDGKEGAYERPFSY